MDRYSVLQNSILRQEHLWNLRLTLAIIRIAIFIIERENVIQDVDIPIENATAFADFFFREIAIHPLWICPIGSYDANAQFGLYPLDPKKLYINFGFWSSLPAKKEKGYYNKLVEAKVTELKGKKGLYSDSFYTKEEFWKMYDKGVYEALKQKYDPRRKLKDLFEKCVDKQ